MYQAVASDLDGILFLPDYFLTPYTKKTPKLLTARGINFIFATDCHYIDVGQIRDNPGTRSYMITSNGARIHDSDGQQISTHNLDHGIAADLFEIVCNDPKIVTNVYWEDEWYMNRHHPEEMCLFKEAVFNYKLHEPGELDPQGISRVFFTCKDHEYLLPLEQVTDTRWGDRVSASSSTLTRSEVTAGGVSKGHALEVVARMLGYTFVGCIAFGDGMNDAGMLSMAGKDCAMANARQRLKDLHPKLEVIDSNTSDAVPHRLRKLHLD